MYRSLQYVIFTPCNATVLNVILYCNIGWCIKDGAVQHSRQQWLIACRSQMVRLGVTVRVRVKKKICQFTRPFIIYENGSGSWRLARNAYLINSGPNGSTH